MKIVLKNSIPILLDNPKDSLDVADYLEENCIRFHHANTPDYHHIVIEPQDVVSTTEFREEFFDRLDALGINISLERVGYNEYWVV